MPPLVEPGPGTLLALEREFRPRLERHLRRCLKGTSRGLFTGDGGGGKAPLRSLAGRIVELHASLGAEETPAYRAARAYLMALLVSKHEVTGANEVSPEYESKRVAAELLAVLEAADV